MLGLGGDLISFAVCPLIQKPKAATVRRELFKDPLNWCRGENVSSAFSPHEPRFPRDAVNRITIDGLNES